AVRDRPTSSDSTNDVRLGAWGHTRDQFATVPNLRSNMSRLGVEHDGDQQYNLGIIRTFVGLNGFYIVAHQVGSVDRQGNDQSIEARLGQLKIFRKRLKSANRQISWVTAG